MPEEAADRIGRFIEAVLARRGVTAVRSEPDLIRLYSHPDVTEIVEGEPWVELALSDQALFEHSSAVPCTPGSFPLERLLALAREGPAVFHARLASLLPEAPPPGAPSVANEPFAGQLLRMEPRAAARALFRIRMQSDDLAEQQVWIAAEGPDGADLLAHWDEGAREPGEPTPLPETLLRQLEERAHRLAEAAAREHLAAVEERRAAEIARLVDFHLAQLDEIAGQLPAGPARQLMQARAALRERLDHLRHCLPGPEPWTRDELLPHGVWPFRHAGSMTFAPGLEGQEQQQLIASMPPAFYWSDLEQAVQNGAAGRLGQLERRVGRNEEAGAALGAQHARLTEEHQSRLADVDRKFHLRVLATPLILDTLTYEVGVYPVTPDGAVETCWDPLAQAWEPLACPACAATGARLWRCEDGALGCDACASVCACGRVRSRDAAFAACAVCQAPACPDCGATCEGCAAWGCAQHVRDCASCGAERCSRCGAACSLCGAAACTEHAPTCLACNRRLCADHDAECRVCRQGVCPEHSRRCAICLDRHCTEHAARCVNCAQEYCSACAPVGLCETCRTLEPVGVATEKALRSRIAATHPAAERGKLRLGRNSAYQVVEARRWPRRWTLVYGEDSGDLIEAHTGWSLGLG